MELRNQHICITGGAGFVGSHLTDRLIEENDIVVVDNFSNGRQEWVPNDAAIVEGDLRDRSVAAEAITDETTLVFHCAANKAVNSDNPSEQFRSNTELTATLLERMQAVGCDRIAFTSSSTVYGEAPRPTPEDYAPLEPISMYGAAKLAEESLLSVYAHSHDMQVWTFRFANIVGPRLQLGAVIPDFIQKLRNDPSELEILGDGRQEKSYMHIDDCVASICHVIKHADEALNVYNLGTRTTTSVKRIADIVADELGIEPEYHFTGGARGWVGDVPRMRLSVEKLAAIGWAAEVSSDDAVRAATRELSKTEFGR